MPTDYMTTESRLPFSLEAEQSVLGAALLDPGCISELVRLVRPEYFYREQHRRIFEVISNKFTMGEPVDIVTVMEAAVREEIFSTPEETKAYLAQLAQLVPSVHNIEAYTGILMEKYHLRALITTSRDIMEQAEAPAAESQDHLQRLSGEDRAEYLGISTGYAALDRVITGLNKSDLLLVAARPGMGKTAFALNIASNVALRSQKTVAIFSLEMSREQLMNRLLAAEGGIDSRRLLTGDLSLEDWGKVADLLTIFSKCPMYMDDTAGITVAEMKAKLRRVRDLGLVVIDYLQLMSTGRRSDNRVQEVSEITRSLKIMAKELNVPVITLSQLSRGPESRSDHRPMLADLRESGSIEQDADIVLFLYREAYYEKEREDQSEAECIVAKNRHGETGSIDLRWDGRYTRFYSVDRKHE